MKRIKVNFLNRSRNDLSSKYLSDDNLIDVAQKQFLKQQEQLTNLQNHLRAFIKGIIDVTDTMDNMYSCFRSIYEPNWAGNTDFNKICQESIKILRQFIADFKCNISKGVNQYGQEFPEMKRSIEKRNKKFIELSKQRKIYENYRNQKKIDESKLKKVKMELDHVDQDYQSQNNILKDKLPKFCDNRIRIYVDLWTKLFDAEGAMFSFLHESRKNQLNVLSNLADLTDCEQYSIKAQINLGNDYDNNLLSTKAYAKSAMSLFSSDIQASETSITEFKSPSFAVTDNKSLNIIPDIDENSTLNGIKHYENIDLPSPVLSDASQTSFFTNSEKSIPIKHIPQNNNPRVTIEPHESLIKNNHTNLSLIMSSGNDFHDSSDVDESGSDNTAYASIKKPQKQLSFNNVRTNSISSFEGSRTSVMYDTIQDNLSYYQVMATFEYIGQDDDELTLRKNDVILVLPWNNEEQMEEGWLYGENVKTKKKGLFPENHTSIFDS